MNTFLEWLKSKNITSHAVAGVLVAIATALVSDQQVRDFVIQLFQAHPKILSVVLAAAGIVFKYSHST